MAREGVGDEDPEFSRLLQCRIGALGELVVVVVVVVVAATAVAKRFCCCGAAPRPRRKFRM
jgi:hypothetical protein